MSPSEPTPGPTERTRMWLAGGPEGTPPDGTAVPIRTILGAPAAPGRIGRLVSVGARWGVWVLALAAVGAGGYGVWHLLYGDRVDGEVFLGRPPAALATTTTSTSTTSTTSTTTSTTSTTSTTVPIARSGTAATVDDSSSGPGPGPTERW